MLLASAAMFVAVFALRQADSDAHDAVALLYVLPILLLSLELGVRGGLLAAALALALVGLWALTSGAGLDAVTIVSYGVVYLAIGAVAGRFADRMRDAQARHRLLLESGLNLAHLEADADLAGTLVAQAQRVIPLRGARVELSDGHTAELGCAAGAENSEKLPIEARGVRYGALTVHAVGSLHPDDRATLAILALQAAVAAENKRLLRSERERALIRAELQSAQVHLAERGSQLRELLVRQEAERSYVSRELHEEAAQVLAAVLIGLRGLERKLDSPGHAATWQELRSDVESTLKSLRSLAVSLQPPVLALGLQSALEELGDAAVARGSSEVTIAVTNAETLDPELKTMIYRIVEEALAAVGPARRLSVRTDAGDRLIVDLQGTCDDVVDGQLAVLKARVELVDGTVIATARELHVVIPLSEAPSLAHDTAAG